MLGEVCRERMLIAALFSLVRPTTPCANGGVRTRIQEMMSAHASAPHDKKTAAQVVCAHACDPYLRHSRTRNVQHGNTGVVRAVEVYSRWCGLAASPDRGPALTASVFCMCRATSLNRAHALQVTRTVTGTTSCIPNIAAGPVQTTRVVLKKKPHDANARHTVNGDGPAWTGALRHHQTCPPSSAPCRCCVSRRRRR